jgi:predicted acyl esterase
MRPLSRPWLLRARPAPGVVANRCCEPCFSSWVSAVLGAVDGTKRTLPEQALIQAALQRPASSGWAGLSSNSSCMANSYPGAVVYRNVMIPMRDGVRLATDIYVPSDHAAGPAEGRFALPLSRTPYSKQRPSIDGRASSQDQAVRAAMRGFAVAIQDTRGRYESEGEFHSMQDDGRDGWDTLDWLGRQDWCNGRIGMYGVSYLGATQMMLAPLRPPHLTAAFSEQPSSDEFTDRTFHAGALTLANVVHLPIVQGADHEHWIPNPMPYLGATPGLPLPSAM